mmetsp:Transcript_44326/g.77824  ORF Transcript_44326/g.77824 Transcript_44326/m.77824 type:complete len:205 (+) Transcript_44326:392-1006(+)
MPGTIEVRSKTRGPFPSWIWNHWSLLLARFMRDFLSFMFFRSTRIGKPRGDLMTSPPKPSGRPHCACLLALKSYFWSLFPSRSSSSKVRRTSVRFESKRLSLNSRRRSSVISVLSMRWSICSAWRCCKAYASLKSSESMNIDGAPPLRFLFSFSTSRFHCCCSMAIPMTPRSTRRSSMSGPLSIFGALGALGSFHACLSSTSSG